MFRLALAMGRTVRELLGAMDSHELTEWIAFDIVEPIGGKRGDIQAAIIAATVANANRGKLGKALQPADFIPEYGALERTTDVDVWLTQRLAEENWDGYASGETAAAGDNPDEDAGDQRLRGAGGQLDDSADGNGVGRVDAAPGGDA